MANDNRPDDGTYRPPNESTQNTSEYDRRSFLSSGATAIMAGGLASGYGMFFAMAGRYFYPSGANRAWIFVSDAAGINPGDSMPFTSPAGVSVMITRLAEDDAPSNEPTADSFLALSSICPHLGCRVHWEASNNRFFCPCHNGVFRPQWQGNRRSASSRRPRPAALRPSGRRRRFVYRNADLDNRQASIKQ